jgi:hypothetical protein
MSNFPNPPCARISLRAEAKKTVRVINARLIPEGVLLLLPVDVLLLPERVLLLPRDGVMLSLQGNRKLPILSMCR